MNEQLIFIGQQIRKFRLEQSLNQTERSEKCVLTKNYISMIENGTANLSINKLAAICSALNITLGDVFPSSASHDVICRINKLPDSDRALCCSCWTCT